MGALGCESNCFRLIMLYAFDFIYAGLSIDAAQDSETGEIWISTPTVETVLGYRSNSTREKVSSKSFKAFAGEGFALGKKKSKSTKQNTTNLYYSKETFLKLIYWELSQGNKVVMGLVFSGFVADFEGSIQAALGNELTEEKREYLRQLVHERIQCFKSWCDVIHDRHVRFYGVKPEGWYYGKLIKHANMRLFGVPNFGSDRTENMTEEQQKVIRDFEAALIRRAQKMPNLEPEALLEQVLDWF
jgi:hypothetical protein